MQSGLDGSHLLSLEHFEEKTKTRVIISIISMKICIVQHKKKPNKQKIHFPVEISRTDIVIKKQLFRYYVNRSR